MAQSRIEQAVSARGEGFTACNHELFQSIAEIHYDPVLEEIAIHSLDDPDPQVAMTAATMLGKYGSPAAQPALLQHFTSWAASWAGRESQLDLTFSESDNRIYQLGWGENLALALTTARAWLSDEAILQRLSQLTSVKRVHDQLDAYLKIWQNPPLVISLNNNPPPSGLDARIAQYEFHSMDELKEKLGQFPAGAKFLLATPPVDSQANARSLIELRTFLSSHGMVVAGEKLVN
jgi:hypothetical protein